MNNIEWLKENGGPTIKLRMINESMVNKDDFDANKLTNELMQIEKIQTAFSYFEQFNQFRLISKQQLYGLIHNCYENSFEMFMAALIRLGFKKGFSLLDEKVEKMREITNI